MTMRKKRVGERRARTGPPATAVGSFRALQAVRRWARIACWLATAILLGLITICAPALGAKEKKVEKTVTGQVLDEAENGIARATVTLTDLNTGKKVAAFTAEDGHYQFSGLQSTHDYEIQASFKNSSSDVRKVTSIDSRHKIVVNLRIPPPEN